MYWTSVGGRSGIIWILIFMIPSVFASMIHDSYKNLLPDSLFTKVTGETNRLSAPIPRIIWGGGSGGMLPRENFGKFDSRKRHILHSLHGSNTTNLYVYFVELFSESRYSWFPSRSAKIHDSQVFKTKIKILTCFVTIIHDSWFRFHPRNLWDFFSPVVHITPQRCKTLRPQVRRLKLCMCGTFFTMQKARIVNKLKDCKASKLKETF